MTHTTTLDDRQFVGNDRYNIATITFSTYTTGAGGEAITKGELAMSRILAVFPSVVGAASDVSVRWNNSTTAPKIVLVTPSTGAEQGTGATTVVVKLLVVGK